jgi:hypothetical protein
MPEDQLSTPNSLADHETADPPYISQLHFPAYALILTPIAIWLAFVYAIDAGIVHATRSDELWAINSQRSVDDGSTALLDDSTAISLRRTMCFGWCPAYSLKIFGSGRVEYIGESYVCAFGSREARADAREVRRLVRAMIASGYFGYSWRPGNFATDSSTAITSLQHQGQSFEIRHYYGDSGAPKWLRAMEGEIDRVAGAAQWLPRQSEDWRLLCPTPEDGSRDVTMDESATD